MPYYLPIAGGRIVGWIPFPRILALCEMQAVSSKIWICVATSISDVILYYENLLRVGNVCRNWLRLKFPTLYSLKTPTWPIHNACFILVMVYTHAMLAFHWSWFTPTQCLLFIGNALHPRNACFSLNIIYTYAGLVIHCLQLTPTHFLSLVIILLILSMARCIGQKHPPGSSLVKVIYYTETPY